MQPHTQERQSPNKPTGVLGTHRLSIDAFVHPKRKILYPRWDLNPHASRQRILNPSCLPFHHSGECCVAPAVCHFLAGANEPYPRFR